MWENTERTEIELCESPFSPPKLQSSICLLTLWTYCQNPILELAFFSSGCNIECFIFQCHTIYHAHILAISFHSMVLGMVGSQLLCTYFPSFSFLSHQSVCQLLSVYICKIRTSYYQSFERHIVQTSRKKICRFHLHGLRRISFDFYFGSLWIFALSYASGSELPSLLVMLKTWNPNHFRVWYTTINQSSDYHHEAQICLRSSANLSKNLMEI